MPRENGIDDIEVHVATICLEEQGGGLKVLVGKRADNRKIYPGLWECGGGQVRKGQSFQDAVKAQMKDEFGLDVEVLFPLGDYKIETEGKVIPGMRYVCRSNPGQMVKIDGAEIIDFRWVTPDEPAADNMIPGLMNDICEAFDLYEKLIGKT